MPCRTPTVSELHTADQPQRVVGTYFATFPAAQECSCWSCGEVKMKSSRLVLTLGTLILFVTMSTVAERSSVGAEAESFLSTDVFNGGR